MSPSYTILFTVLYKFAIPIVCVLGILGNITVLVVLRKLGHTAINFYLRSLAISDLGFCCLALFTMELPVDEVFTTGSFMLIYRMSAFALINVFIMTSTWLIVCFSCERYIAVCKPYKAPMIISKTRTIIAIAATYCFSIIFNLPIIWRYEANPLQINITTNNSYFSTVTSTTLVKVSQVPIASDSIDLAYRIAWSVFGNIVPVTFLIYCNTSIINAIRRTVQKHSEFELTQFNNKSKVTTCNTGVGRELIKDDKNQWTKPELSEQNSNGHANAEKDGILVFRRTTTKRKTRKSSAESSRETTITLVFVAVFFLVLVAPSEISRIVLLLQQGDYSKNLSEGHKWVGIIVNFMQTVNFANNFFLYAAVNRTFRTELIRLLGEARKRIFCGGSFLNGQQTCTSV